MEEFQVWLPHPTLRTPCLWSQRAPPRLSPARYAAQHQPTAVTFQPEMAAARFRSASRTSGRRRNRSDGNPTGNSVGTGGIAPLPAATIAIGFLVLITGAMHEDGLADLCDGFGGGSTAQVHAAFTQMSSNGQGTFTTSTVTGQMANTGGGTVSQGRRL